MYFSKLYTMEITKGIDYLKAKRVVLIAIIDYELDITKEIKKMETIWNLREKDNGNIILTDKIELRIIEIGKVLREYKLNKNNRKAQWIMFLNNPNDEEVRKVMENNEDIKKATEEVEKMSEDDKLRRLAWLREKAIMDEKAIYAAGLNKGIDKGIEIRNKQIAKEMKLKNIPIKTISEVTGLIEKEIEEL